MDGIVMNGARSAVVPVARTRSSAALGIIGAAIVAAALSLYFFSPRFVLWRLLKTSVTPPEVVRAGDALRQMAHPLLPIDNNTNRVLEWRLLFPVLGHIFRLSDAAYLALPSLGALIALCYGVAIARRHGYTWPHAIACATLLATSSWFFVSVGWLGYFDSWYVLALLIIVFARAHWIAVAAVLAGPWIDERVVLTLPLCLFLRATYLSDPKTGGGTKLDRRQMLGFFLALLPWVLTKAILALSGRDDVTTRYLDDMAGVRESIHPSSYLVGLWEGIRWGWVGIFALALYFWRRAPRWGVGFLLLLASTIVVNLGLAQDLSRSVSVIAPAILLGLILCSDSSVFGDLRAVVALAFLNLLFPAEHVIGDHRVPILYFEAELSRNQDPLSAFSPRVYQDRGVAYAMSGRDELALEMFDIAIRLNPDFAEAISNRSLVQARLGNLEMALAGADRALALDAPDPDLWLNRAEIRMLRSDPGGALADIEESIRRSGADWPRLGEARAALAAANERLGRSN